MLFFLFETHEWSSGEKLFDISHVTKQDDEISEWKLLPVVDLFKKEVREMFYPAQRKMLGWWIASRLGVCQAPVFKSLEDPWEEVPQLREFAKNEEKILLYHGFPSY